MSEQTDKLKKNIETVKRVIAGAKGKTPKTPKKPKK